MKSLLFSLVLCLTLNKAHGIYGGCMSFSSSTSNVSGHIEVNLLSVFFKDVLLTKTVEHQRDYIGFYNIENEHACYWLIMFIPYVYKMCQLSKAIFVYCQFPRQMMQSLSNRFWLKIFNIYISEVFNRLCNWRKKL